jgi:transposase
VRQATSYFGPGKFRELIGKHYARLGRSRGYGRLIVVRLPEAILGFVLLARRWVVERSLGWLSRFRRLARDCERLPGLLAGFRLVA